MAGYARYTALLDACVLYPVVVCDALLSVAVSGLFAAKWTTRDFPQPALAPFGLEAIHPDQFLVAQMDLDHLAVLAGFKEQRQRLRNPAMAPQAFADSFERNGLVSTAQRLREAAALI